MSTRPVREALNVLAPLIETRPSVYLGGYLIGIAIAALALLALAPLS